jgi:hypothetical protein
VRIKTKNLKYKISSKAKCGVISLNGVFLSKIDLSFSLTSQAHTFYRDAVSLTSKLSNLQSPKLFSEE